MRLKHTPLYKGLTKPSKAGPVWTGELRLNEKALTQPLQWKKPRTIFVNSMSDLFHEDMPDEWIDQVFAVMALTPQHTYQVLTKRAERMRDYLTSINDNDGGRLDGFRDALIEGAAQKIYADRTGEDPSMWLAVNLPLPNVWLGTSVEDQRRADERVWQLLETPAAVRFLSCEPLLGAIDLTNIVQSTSGDTEFTYDALNGAPDCELGERVDWVIVGGESGRGSRPMHPEWVRDIRDRCVESKVPFFFKQWGEWAPHTAYGGVFPLSKLGKLFCRDGNPPTFYALPSEMEEISSGLHGAFEVMRHVGKKAAGRLLDAKEWSQYPEREA